MAGRNTLVRSGERMSGERLRVILPVIKASFSVKPISVGLTGGAFSRMRRSWIQLINNRAVMISVLSNQIVNIKGRTIEVFVVGMAGLAAGWACAGVRGSASMTTRGASIT